MLRGETLFPALTGLSIESLCIDSRQARPGSLFFALPGVKADGNAFAHAAIQNGAVGVVSTTPQEGATVPWIVVKDARAALAGAARVFYGRDTSSMRYAGITGTNGKTTLTYLLEAIVRAAARLPLVIGTVEHRLGDRHWPTAHTTPEAITLCERIVEAETLGADWTVMEVSSHGLDQYRADSLAFDVVGFTNLTPDHLDYHGTMQRYFAAKRRLFTELVRADGTAAINLDGAFGQDLFETCRSIKRSRVLGCSAVVASADVYVFKTLHGISATEMALSTPAGDFAIRSPLIGAFNVENVALAVTMAMGAGFSLDVIKQGIEGLRGVPGRLERVVAPDGRMGFVDYAHTPDALERVLQTLNALRHERVICVFGCGGDRDKTKRPLMGNAASTLSDFVVLTSDNPRTEDPEAIIADVLPGMGARKHSATLSKESFTVVKDRKEAIRFAASQTRKGDILLIAGKGHEDYQIIGSTKHHFDDREELLSALQGTA